MQTHEEILTTATDELVQCVLTKLERATPPLDAKHRRISTLNDEISRDPVLAEPLKQKISEYISLFVDDIGVKHQKEHRKENIPKQGAYDGIQSLWYSHSRIHIP